MKATRIKCYKVDSEYNVMHSELIFECIYLLQSPKEALQRCLYENPEFAKCVALEAEPYDTEDPKNKEHFAVCERCGCVRLFN